jgi:hypothetical protein
MSILDKSARLLLGSTALLLAAWGCNSHPLVGYPPEVWIQDGGINVAPPPGPTAGSTVQETGGSPFTEPGKKDAGVKVDTRVPPPTEETFACPSGTVRMHVRDVWSKSVDPTLGTSTKIQGVLIIDTSGGWMQYGARQETADCDWYSVCVPKTLTKFQIKSLGDDACPTGNGSGDFNASSVMGGTDAYLEHTGSSASLATDYPSGAVGAGKFQLTGDKNAVQHPLCGKSQPDQSIPDGFTKLHFRWPWADPALTGFAGSGCGKEKLGYDTPPYPSSLKVTGAGCEMQAFLEFQDSTCPWYTVLIPNSKWSTDASKPTKITFRYANDSVGLWTPDLPLPARKANEYWAAYAGAPDNTAASIPKCMDWSQNPGSFFFYTANPGPGYAHCGGGETTNLDPCNPAVPETFHTVHFRYIWAGQKTFTFFPKPALMPKWIELEVSSNKVICFREQDRPWYNCPVPDAFFKPGATWRAVDKTHNPEWNTVAPRPFPETPGDYWIRWNYGKPDIPPKGSFKVFDYYPDSAMGDWSATANWNDEMCAAKPPSKPVTVGYGYGGWFPYNKTRFLYPNGGSLAYAYDDVAKLQDLLNFFVFQRYEIWRDNYVVTDDISCNSDPSNATARVVTDPGPTVSEGQGYGMAIAAAIGDKPTFTKLWNFTRHFLSQSSKKYCGGLMGWIFKGTCRPLDATCDPDKSSDSCGGDSDSAFDGDVDIGIGLLFAARQWPADFKQAAIDWLIKMECEVNDKYDGKWNYPAPGDTWDKNCQFYPDKPCGYAQGQVGQMNMGYNPPGYFRAFGDFLKANVADSAEGERHRAFWYKTAETMYELFERCYDQPDVHPGLVSDWGKYDKPCSIPGGNYDWSRALWRTGIDAAWFGDNTSLPENAPNSSSHYPGKSRMQAKIDNTQGYYNDFYKDNPPEPNANRFSTICQDLKPDGKAKNCDSAYGHNSYFVNTAMCSYVSKFNNDGKTTLDIRREAIEEAVSTTVENDRYYQESIGVYSMLFLSGNFPNPMSKELDP